MANGMEQGLAAQQGAGQASGIALQDVVNMLMQGVDPEQLLQQGVPMELIREAIQLIMAQEQQAQAASTPPSTDAGLAASQPLY